MIKILKYPDILTLSILIGLNIINFSEPLPALKSHSGFLRPQQTGGTAGRVVRLVPCVGFRLLSSLRFNYIPDPAFRDRPPHSVWLSAV